MKFFKMLQSRISLLVTLTITIFLIFTQMGMSFELKLYSLDDHVAVEEVTEVCEDRGIFRYCDGNIVFFTEQHILDLMSNGSDVLRIYEIYKYSTYYLVKGLFTAVFYIGLGILIPIYLRNPELFDVLKHEVRFVKAYSLMFLTISVSLYYFMNCWPYFGSLKPLFCGFYLMCQYTVCRKIHEYILPPVFLVAQSSKEFFPTPFGLLKIWYKSFIVPIATSFYLLMFDIKTALGYGWATFVFFSGIGMYYTIYYFIGSTFFFFSHIIAMMGVSGFCFYDELLKQLQPDNIIALLEKVDSKYRHLVWNILIFYDDIHNSTNKRTMFKSVVKFLGHYYGIIDIMRVAKIVMTSDTIEAQSLSDARNLLDTWKDAKESDISLKLGSVITGLAHAGLTSLSDLPFTAEGFAKTKSNLNNLSLMNINSLTYSLADMILTFCEIGYECYVDKSVQPLLVRDRAVRDWMEDYRNILKRLDELPINEKTDIPLLLEDMGVVVGRGNALMSKKNPMVAPLWRKLMDRYSELRRTHNVSATRRCPFSVLLHGPPGIGKSSVTQLVGSIYHDTVTKNDIHDIEWSPTKNMYTYNPESNFWDGYKGASQWFVVLDDLARQTKHMIVNGMTTFLNDIITIVNVVGIATHQAAIEDKGCIPLVPKLVVATTNTKNLNAHLGTSCPEAVLRRFPIVIEPILKPEFVDPVTGTMKKLDKIVHNAWDYRIQTFKVSKADDKLVGSYVNVPGSKGDISTGAELCIYLRRKIIEHERASDVMAEGLKVADYISCHHGVPSYFDCPECADEVTLWDAVEPDSDDESTRCIPRSGDSVLSDNTIIEAQSFINKRLPLLGRVYSAALNKGRKYLPEESYNRLLYTVANAPGGGYAVADHAIDVMSENVPRKIVMCRTVFKAAIATGAAAGIILLFYEMFSDKNKADEEKKNPEAIVGQTNIWSKVVDDFIIPITSKPGNRYEIVRSIRSSQFSLIIKDVNGVTQRARGFALRDGFFVTVAHPFVVGDQWKCEVDYGLTHSRITSVQSFTLDRRQCQFVGDDIMVFEAPLMARKSLYKFLPLNIDKNSRDGIVLNFGRNGELVEGPVRTYVYSENTYKSGEHSITSNVMLGDRLDRNPAAGECGSIMVANYGGSYFICGIHVAGSPSGSTIAFSQLSQNLFKAIGKPLLAMSNMSDTPYYSAFMSGKGKFGAPFRKGPHAWANKCDAVILGSYPGGVSPTSSVERTIICSAVESVFNMTLDLGAPLMGARFSGGKWINPWTIAVEQQGDISGDFSTQDVFDCATAMIMETTRDNSWLKDVRNYPLEVAINGIPGVERIDSIPMTTSGGFYFPGEKRSRFEGEVGEYLPNEDLKKHYDFIRESYLNGERASVVFNGALKDEPRSKAKIAEGKTRVFAASDLAFSLVVREQYLGVTKAIMENNYITECAVGFNCYKEWDCFAKWLLTFGDNKLIAGDYKAYDKRLPALFILASFYVLDAWRTQHGPLSPQDILLSRGVATDTAFPIINMNKDLFQYFGGNPSGHPLTAIVNSIANSLFMRFCYKEVGCDLMTFQENVKLMTYGDDNVMCSNIPRFNHTSISTILRDHDITYTMADKKTESIPFISLSRVDFLKRGFRLENDVYYAALDLNSIVKSLCIRVVSPNVTDGKHLADCYWAARCEWSMHGKAVFEANVSKMERIFDLPEFLHVRNYFGKRHKYDFNNTLEVLMKPDEDFVVTDFGDIDYTSRSIGVLMAL